MCTVVPYYKREESFLRKAKYQEKKKKKDKQGKRSHRSERENQVEIGCSCWKCWKKARDSKCEDPQTSCHATQSGPRLFLSHISECYFFLFSLLLPDFMEKCPFFQGKALESNDGQQISFRGWLQLCISVHLPFTMPLRATGAKYVEDNTPLETSSICKTIFKHTHQFHLQPILCKRMPALIQVRPVQKQTIGNCGTTTPRFQQNQDFILQVPNMLTGVIFEHVT